MKSWLTVLSLVLILACAEYAGAAPRKDRSNAGKSASAPRYGALMTEVGRRFELLGRAEKARRFDLAAFELGELEEIFEEDLPRAEPPRESAGVKLAPLAEAFLRTQPPALAAPLKARDDAAFAKAFAVAAATCNACHQVSGHPFIEIPTEPGAAVPKLDPVSDAPAGR